MVFYIAFNMFPVISWQQLTYSNVSQVSSVQGWGSGVSSQRTSPRITKRIQCTRNFDPQVHFTTKTHKIPHALPKFVYPKSSIYTSSLSDGVILLPYLQQFQLQTTEKTTCGKPCGIRKKF